MPSQAELPPPPPPPPAYAPRRRRKWPLAVLVVIVLLLWNAGIFDHALVNVGLNRHPCIRNGFGATFCGQEAKDYCQNTAGLRRLANNPSDDCDTVLNEP